MDVRGDSKSCEIWMDHVWSERLIGAGHDAIRGAYQDVALRCEACGRWHAERRFLDPQRTLFDPDGNAAWR